MSLLQKPSFLSKKPGVYIFQDHNKKPLYIGKAANIKKRLTSYFQNNISERVRRLRQEAQSIIYEELPTEFDALVREAELIKKYRPKFNVLMRDDKSYFYVVFTKETFPRIIATHKLTLFRASNVLGPFTEGKILFAILKLLRKSFPYCTCKKPHKRKCLSADIGRCFGFCCILSDQLPTKVQSILYKKSISAIKKILSGKTNDILQNLKQDMRLAANKHEFERATTFRNQFQNLESIRSHRFIIEEKNPLILTHAKTAGYFQKLLKRSHPITRIEGYDISNISGAHAAASLVVFENGKPKKEAYKKFKIHYTGISDFDMLKEVLNRRLAHHEWILPDLILLDGGMPQLRAVVSVVEKIFKKKNPRLWPFTLAGLSKAKNVFGRTKRKASGEEILTIYGGKRMYVKDIPQDAMHTLQAVRDESHRFAQKYHHLLLKNKYFDV